MDWEKLHVLVIDDEELVRKLIRRILLKIGIVTISLAEHGAEAIEMLEKTYTRPDIILCDLQMPEMNGFQFVAKLRSLPDPELRNIPVVIVTSHDDEETVATASKFEINGFIVKPMSPATLTQHLESALKSVTPFGSDWEIGT